MQLSSSYVFVYRDTARLGHGCHAVFLVLIFLEHGVFEPFGGFGALRIHVGRPEVGDCVFDDEEGGDGESPDQPVGGSWDVMFNTLSLAVLRLLDIVGLGAPSID